MEKKTPLYENHVAAGGKIVPFAGYLLPVQYPAGVIAEHKAVREGCGMFDVSHMGEIRCTGKDALKNLNRLLTNDFTVMYDGQARYSPMCNEQGGVVDDLIVYKEADENYFIVVNAANKDKDFAWMKAHQTGEVCFTDISEEIVQIALQGPLAEQILRRLTAEENIPTAYYSAVFDGKVGEIPCIISRTGYTGADGFEFYCDAKQGPALWDLLLAEGKPEGLIPCGLGARDTLRLEAGMPLYGHEMDDSVSPREAGLGMFVKMEKTDFIGKAALELRGTPARKRIGLKVTGRGIIREHCDLYANGRLVGRTTSGTHAPYLGYPIAMALVEAGVATVGSVLEADVRGRKVAAEIVKLPFYKKEAN
ncbi:glycine cleavage system aminomethyltransferase GcvT [Hominifimenecus sp. rT4P-3]|uniref:glycine cleavage system aminomethyltransferase GcvT n=1 Tax=Hominifimenecus sp. rT4P-3 TaxID=3242979 RepID=UPI003DA45392